MMEVDSRAEKNISETIPVDSMPWWLVTLPACGGTRSRAGSNWGSCRPEWWAVQVPCVAGSCKPSPARARVSSLHSPSLSFGTRSLETGSQAMAPPRPGIRPIAN